MRPSTVASGVEGMLVATGQRHRWIYDVEWHPERGETLADWPALGDDAALSIPTPEHYLPLLYALALARDGDALQFFNDDVIGSLSMTSLIIGTA